VAQGVLERRSTAGLVSQSQVFCNRLVGSRLVEEHRILMHLVGGVPHPGAKGDGGATTRNGTNDGSGFGFTRA